MKTRNLLLFFCLLITLTVRSKVLTDRHAANRQRDARHQKWLNNSFDTVKQVKGGTLLERPPISFGSSFRGAKVFSIGDKFSFNDDHWSCDCTVTGVAPDGVLVHYDFAIRSVENAGSGTIKLYWKSLDNQK